MDRRTYVALGTTALTTLSGCVSVGMGEGDESESTNDGDENGADGDGDGGSQAASPDEDDSDAETADGEPPDLNVEGEHLEGESDSDAELTEHAFEYVGESTQPWAVVGTASHTREERADLQVSVNFIDEDNTIIRDSYDLITDVAGNQSAEFIVEYAGDDPERVSEYEIVVDVR